MIGVIADDLTGAAELGAVGLRHGLRAEIVRSGQPSGTADLVCMDTDSRSCNPVEAARRAAAAAQLLRAAGADWIYKKVDSVLRGNVTAEVEAVMQQLNFNRALLLPANPALGRVIRDGEYLVHGQPIHQTEFAHDPEYPRRSSQVLRLLGAPEHFLLRLAHDELAVPANTLLIRATESSAQVHQWAESREPEVLSVGGSEYFGALLAAAPAPAVPVAAEPISFDQGKQLFICGTTSKSAHLLAKAAKARHTPVFNLPQELMWGEPFSRGAQEVISQRVLQALGTARRVLLCVGLPPVHDVAIARRLATYLVDIAELVLRSVEIKNIFAEGGATAAELVRRMQWPRLTVCHEWAPGVATLAVVDDDSQWLTIKPGSYSWPEQWTHAL